MKKVLSLTLIAATVAAPVFSMKRKRNSDDDKNTKKHKQRRYTKEEKGKEVLSKQEVAERRKKEALEKKQKQEEARRRYENKIKREHEKKISEWPKNNNPFYFRSTNNKKSPNIYNNGKKITAIAKDSLHEIASSLQKPNDVANLLRVCKKILKQGRKKQLLNLKFSHYCKPKSNANLNDFVVLKKQAELNKNNDLIKKIQAKINRTLRSIKYKNKTNKAARLLHEAIAHYPQLCVDLIMQKLHNVIEELDIIKVLYNSLVNKKIKPHNLMLSFLRNNIDDEDPIYWEENILSYAHSENDIETFRKIFKLHEQHIDQVSIDALIEAIWTGNQNNHSYDPTNFILTLLNYSTTLHEDELMSFLLEQAVKWKNKKSIQILLDKYYDQIGWSNQSTSDIVTILQQISTSSAQELIILILKNEIMLKNNKRILSLIFKKDALPHISIKNALILLKTARQGNNAYAESLILDTYTNPIIKSLKKKIEKENDIHTRKKLLSQLEQISPMQLFFYNANNNTFDNYEN